MPKNRILTLAIVFAATLASEIGLAQAFSYFGTGIDYWSRPTGKNLEETPSKRDIPTAVPSGEESGSPDSTQEFQWQKFLDPKEDEFFKEGEHVPPEPFMEIVRNPSNHNLKMWFAYIDKKNALATRLQQRMEEYLAKSGGPAALPEGRTIESMQASLTPTASDAKRYRFRMYFDSQCPHCEKMMATMSELTQRGFFVEAKQIDELPFNVARLPFSVTRASRDEVSKHNITSVPLLLVGDLEAKVVYKMSGYKTVEGVFGELKSGRAR